MWSMQQQQQQQQSDKEQQNETASATQPASTNSDVLGPVDEPCGSHGGDKTSSLATPPAHGPVDGLCGVKRVDRLEQACLGRRRQSADARNERCGECYDGLGHGWV